MSEVDVDWGEIGLARLLTRVEALAIVDVLSFSTCISVAADRDVAVYPVATGDDGVALAERLGARLAKRRRDAGPGDVSLSPASLLRLPRGGSLVLPSPNGSALSAIAAGVPEVAVFAGCLRNRRAAASALSDFRRIGIVAAGERWPDRSLRPAIEDWLGAGAIVDAMEGVSLSAEAEFARTAYRASRPDLMRLMHESLSGKELAEEDHKSDVDVAVELDGSDRVSRLIGGAYQVVRR
ncbi:MAG: 2-phosphosulfolactate phosphatase [Alphaproteobacteria bacterium]|nr:2-phosphosulfolactate phosphatase [Alphaproteobacteria bacterium]